ncbi:MAG: hypothetical protein IT307_04825 [Chloroflexi bacterium]|nr:hypothetical protein [Chloroflexota bacterium]
MDAASLPGLFTWEGVLLWYAWNFAVLASLQLTVRLIRAFSIRQTALGALGYTIGSLPIGFAFFALAGVRVPLYPVAMLASGLLGLAVARWALRIKRLRGQIVAAGGTALLSGPWPLFFDTVLRAVR